MFSRSSQYVPQLSGDNRRITLAWLGLTAGAFLVILLIVGAPVAMANDHALVALTIYRGFSKVCHQLPERSFFIAGYPVAVCARCSGLYIGFAGAMLIYPLARSLRETDAPARKWLFLSAMPMAVDFTLGYSGLWANTHASRFITGLLLGAVAVFYVMPGLMDLTFRLWRRSTNSADQATFTIGAATALATAPSDYSAPDRRI